MNNRTQSVGQWLAMAVLIAAMAWRLYLLWGEMAMQGAFAEHGQESGFGGTDWVRWENGPQGVYAQSVHPVIEGNPQFGGGYFQPGDILRRIDQEEVYDARVPELITLHARPGTVLMYQIERPGIGDGSGEWMNLLVPVSILPRLSFVSHTGLWVTYPWILMAGVFISLVSLLILFPILRASWRDQWPSLLLVFTCFLTFASLGLRHGNLLVRTEYVETGAESVLLLTALTLIPLFGTLSLYSSMRGALRWATLPLFFLVVVFVGISLQTFTSNQLAGMGSQLEESVWHLFSVQVAGMMLISVIGKWRGRSLLDKGFHLGALAYSLHLILIPNTIHSGSGVDGNELMTFLGTAGILLPLVSVGASQLKFGRVSLVLTSSLQYVLLAALALFFFYVIEQVFSGLGFQFRYQIYLELSILLILILFMRALWKANESNWRGYFILAQQQRRERIGEFTARVPQYSSTSKLQEDLVEALKQYFEAGFVSLQMQRESSEGPVVNIPDELQASICRTLAEHSSIWVRNRQLATVSLAPEQEAALNASPASAVLPLSVNEEIFGLLFLGPKRRGVYNLDDIEVLARLIQQTRLTLGVLHLLEREKLLLEKNYEANLTALRSQINPHFLFNTLNTISALIHDDPDGAEKAVEKLAFIFRYTLKHSDKASVSLRDELGLVRTYLEIEQIRFGHRLNLSFDLDAGLMDLEIPAFAVQTIVENCIKHGIARITGNGLVDIKLMEKEGFAVCEIFDNGPGIDVSKVRSSTGLNNILTRMSRIYGREDLVAFENTGKGTKVTLRIPIP